MGKVAKVRMLDILVLAGYDLKTCINAVGYPICESITLIKFVRPSGLAPEEGVFHFEFSKIKREVETRTLKPNVTEKVDFIPGLTKAEFYVSAELLIKYKGSKIDSKYISSSDQIRPAPGWPLPAILKPEESEKDEN